MYSLNTNRRKAHKIGYQVTKGIQHFQNHVWTDSSGERHTGYMVMDMATGLYEWGCYDSDFDYLWDLDDVVQFLEIHSCVY